MLAPRTLASKVMLHGYRVEGFLSTGIQTLVFPSEEMLNQRKKENKNASDDEINYEIFTTKDSLKV